MADYPGALPHGEIEQIFPDVFLVRGSYRANALISFGRSMVVLREGTALTLVNSVRLTEQGERALLALGEVKGLVRLGGHHGLDDPYYRARFSPTYWSAAPGDSPTERLVDGQKGPVSRARAFVFEKSPSEAALLVEQAGGNLLLTCDSVQNWTDTRHCSLAGSVAVRAMGCIKPAKIGPIWLKKINSGKNSLMWPDFDRLLSLDFNHLQAGHGTPLRDNAKDIVARSCAETLGPR